MIFIRTEYSFKQCFVHMDQAIDKAIELGHKEVCLIDSSTFGFVRFQRICKEKGVIPVYGLTVMVTDSIIKSRSKYETFKTCREVTLIALDTNQVKELYHIYTLSTKQKYYFNRVLESDTQNLDCMIIDPPKTAKYLEPEHLSTYQCITGARGVLNKKDMEFDIMDIDITPYPLPSSGMIKYNKNKSFELLCWTGLSNLGLDEKPEYVDRLEYEIKMIMEKDFQDYFLIVGDMINKAKETMIVGPGRGSSGGSLVCYCMGITNIDPIKHGLIFERFIDTNRYDFPDIDTDYPDKERQNVIKQAMKNYKHAIQLGIVSRYQPKVILGDFAKAYDIPAYELTNVKNTIIKRSFGDARSKACLEDTLKGTEIGRGFIYKYPQMDSAKYAEGHARHSGKHAAGIIITDEDINNYASFDSVNDHLCLEGKQAEEIGLLKIDCLGLRTLSVIQDCLSLSSMDYDSIYSIDIEDKNALDVFNQDKLSDIFQFDGDAIGMINKQIDVQSFNDIVAITALGRPGALNSGGTGRYIKVSIGADKPVYYGDVYKKITEPTNGIVVYQEQTMHLLRQIGNLSWGDINIMRKIISKSRGDEFFAKYKQKFIDGAIENEYSEEDAEIIWGAIASMGSYAFNKSHAVAYAMISYWCAYCKYYYPLNFLAANLNNAKDDEHALKMLRQYVNETGIEYVPVDPDISGVGWTIYDGKLIGGLDNIIGIGEKKAKEIMGKREAGVDLTPAVMNKLLNPVTPFDRLNPIFEDYNEYYVKYVLDQIDKLNEGACMVLGKVTMKDLRDRNDIQSVLKRGGKKVTENQYYANIIIADDTGSIKCTIAPFDMDRLDGIELINSLAINDIVVVKGSIRKGWQTIRIKEIIKV